MYKYGLKSIALTQLLVTLRQESSGKRSRRKNWAYRIENGAMSALLAHFHHNLSNYNE
jgi:hypothetical protein